MSFDSTPVNREKKHSGIDKITGKPIVNIFRCRICGRFGMREELDLHECRALKDYKIDNEKSILWCFDGHQWYPLKLREAYPTEHDREEFKTRLDRT